MTEPRSQQAARVIVRAVEMLRHEAQLVRDSETDCSGPFVGQITDVDAKAEVEEMEAVATQLETLRASDLRYLYPEEWKRPSEGEASFLRQLRDVVDQARTAESPGEGIRAALDLIGDRLIGLPPERLRTPKCESCGYVESHDPNCPRPKAAASER